MAACAFAGVLADRLGGCILPERHWVEGGGARTGGTRLGSVPGRVGELLLCHRSCNSSPRAAVPRHSFLEWRLGCEVMHRLVATHKGSSLLLRTQLQRSFRECASYHPPTLFLSQGDHWPHPERAPCPAAPTVKRKEKTRQAVTAIISDCRHKFGKSSKLLLPLEAE